LSSQLLGEIHEVYFGQQFSEIAISANYVSRGTGAYWWEVGGGDWWGLGDRGDRGDLGGVRRGAVRGAWAIGGMGGGGVRYRAELGLHFYFLTHLIQSSLSLQRPTFVEPLKSKGPMPPWSSVTVTTSPT